MDMNLPRDAQTLVFFGLHDLLVGDRHAIALGTSEEPCAVIRLRRLLFLGLDLRFRELEQDAQLLLV